ncbi:uncharacterized protein LOC135492965 [Lineus longissimus]|uniref:uncharacterized protein LOC135492965 n=1 Tax=Lineus longissimus TaxID=88925 RepID=UPI00315D5249
MPRCMVPGCGNMSGVTSGIRFKQWPLKDEELSRKWLHAIRRADLDKRKKTFTKNDRVCELHFEKDCFESEGELKVKAFGRKTPKTWIRADAVPTLCKPGQFPVPSPTPSSSSNSANGASGSALISTPASSVKVRTPKRPRSVDRIQRLTQKNIVQSLLQDSPSKASEVSNTPTVGKKRRKNDTEPATPPDADVIPTTPPVKHDVDTQTDWDMAFMQRIDGMLYGSVEVIQHDHSYSKANQPDQDSTLRPRSSSEGTREADLQPPQLSPDISSADVLQSCQLLPGGGSNLHVDDALAATSESDVTSDDSDFELPTTARKVDDCAKHFDILDEDQFSNSAGDYIEQKKFIVYEDEAWREHRSKLVQALQDRSITVIGDGRCDSPGHSAKYAASCEGDPVLLKEIWTSILYHVQDIHEWGDKTMFHACNHAPLTDEESRKKKWLEPDSPSLKALATVVNDKRLLADVGKLSSFCHTGILEVYHSEMIKYMPKSRHFSYKGMVARTQLVALDHNEHSERKQITNKSGKPRYYHSCPKGRDHLVAKNVKEQKDYAYLPKMMTAVVEHVMSGTKPTPVLEPILPQRITSVERPDLEESLRYSRFIK